MRNLLWLSLYCHLSSNTAEVSEMQRSLCSHRDYSEEVLVAQQLMQLFVCCFICPVLAAGFNHCPLCKQRAVVTRPLFISRAGQPDIRYLLCCSKCEARN